MNLIRTKKDELQKVAQDIAVKAYQQTQGNPTDGGNNNGGASNGGHGDSVDADFSDVQ
jgi:molecular chaperone DnaK